MAFRHVRTTSAVAAILAVAVVLLAPGGAAAGDSPVTVSGPVAGDASLQPMLRRALGIARARFGPVCPGGITAHWRSLPLRFAGRRTSRPWARAVAPACRIDFNLDLYRDPAWRRIYSFPWFCTLVVHEYGHLAGHRHTTDRTDVMYRRIKRVHRPCS